jgi:hypothetical protein
MAVPTINFHSFLSQVQFKKKNRTQINEKEMENNCHFGTLFGTGIVEAKPLDEIEKLRPLQT